MSENNIYRLKELASRFNDLPEESFEKLLTHLKSAEIVDLPEEERLGIWLELTKFIAHHKRHSAAKWALSLEIIAQIEAVSKSLEPANPLNEHVRLFKHNTFDLFDVNTGWEAQQEKIKELGTQAVCEIYNFGGLKAVMELSEQIELASDLGGTVAQNINFIVDEILLRELLNSVDKTQMQFVAGLVLGKFSCEGWQWFNALK